MLVYMVPVMALASMHRFLEGEHVINLGTCGNNVGLHVMCGGCIGSVTLHVSVVGSGGVRQMVFD